MKIIYAEQNSEEWHLIRSKAIGASDISAILHLSPYSTREELLQRKAGILPPVVFNANMSYGATLEPVVRSMAEFEFGERFEPRVVQHKEYDFLMASLDGINFDEDTILEIKVCNRKIFNVLSEGYNGCASVLEETSDSSCPPSSKEAVFFCDLPNQKGFKKGPADHFYAQIQHQLMCVPEAEKAILYAYNKNETAWNYIYPDSKYQDLITTEAIKFTEDLEKLKV